MNPILSNSNSKARCLLGFVLAILSPALGHAAEIGQTFPTPEAAVAALSRAVATTNRTELRAIFGPAVAEIVNPDAVQAANEYAAFASAFTQSNHLVRESETSRVLKLGKENWPFPVPLVQKDGRWFFDTAAGADELVTRRIGRNELETLQVMRAYAQAQREYASIDRDGDEVLEYAQKIVSTPGSKDGLFWSPELDGEISPFGPLAAEAAAEGYGKRRKGSGDEPRAFHGYFFKILTRQGSHPPGGKYDYVINGNMIGGFALVAWPAEYDESGVMTFVINQQGRVYQKNLGPETTKIAEAMKAYDPDATWKLSPE